MDNQIKGQLSANGWRPVMATGTMAAELTVNGRTLFSVLDDNGDFRVYATNVGSRSLENLIARGNLKDHDTI